jgi:hypothetical protein
MIRIISFLSILIISVNISFGQELVQKREINKGNILLGACLFLIPEAACIAVATLDSKSSSAYLPIPIAGPFIATALDRPSTEGLIVAFGIGMVETIGITLFTVGTVGKKKIYEQAMIYPVIRKNGYGLKLKVNL